MRLMNKKYREKLFLHLDGIVIIPIINSFLNKGILDYIYEHEKNNITDFKKNFQINEGYGNVALRLLKSIGIIKSRNQKNKNLILQIINLKNTIYNISILYKYYINLEKQSYEKFCEEIYKNNYKIKIILYLRNQFDYFRGVYQILLMSGVRFVNFKQALTMIKQNDHLCYYKMLPQYYLL